MTEEEFKKLKPGDKVKLVSVDKMRECRLYVTGLNKWAGQIVTISKIIDKDNYKAFEKAFEIDEDVVPPLKWRFSHDMIERKVGVKNGFVDIYVRRNKTIAKRDNGKVGIAKCDPRDKFDEAKGAIIAVAKAYGWQYASDDTDNLTLTRHAEPRKETAKDRVKRELKELSERRNSLSRVLQGASKKLPESMKVESEAFNLLEMRLRVMEMYEAILARRLAIWKD